MKLISTTDFVIQKEKEYQFRDDCEFAYIVRKYANFLKQPLKLEMFVPCDEYGNFLEEPCDYKYWIKDDENGAYEGQNEYMCIKYQQAKEKVLFKGIDLDTAKFHCERNDRTIEYFTFFNVELTPNAIKEIGLTI